MRKKIEELISRKTELVAETGIYIAIGDCISSNMDRCKNERNYFEWQARIDPLTDVTAKLKNLHQKHKAVLKQLKQMC